MMHSHGDDPRLTDPGFSPDPSHKFLHRGIIAIQGGQHQTVVLKEFASLPDVGAIHHFQPVFPQHVAQALTDLVIGFHYQGALTGGGGNGGAGQDGNSG